MSGNLKKFLAGLATTSLAVALLQGLSTPASAAVATNGATIGNGITTTDLAAAGMTPTLLAQALAGTNFSVSNVKYTGAPQQAGKIHIVDPAVVSFNDGVILSSGNIADVVGPNKSESTTGDMAGAGDTDLTNLILNTATVNPQTYDAASLEFDFVATDPNATNVYFTYSFGSEEYMEWVNLFNDVFAFYVNGKNCATIPVTDPNTGTTANQIVSIDSINGNVNPNFYRDNGYWAPPANPLNIESDGLTVELICSEPILAGQTNHIKLAIADTSDQILDSVVMIKSGSFSTTPPESCNDGVDNADDDILVDMEDPECIASTTPAPTGQSGVGTNSLAPPFTGNAGLDVTLDATSLGWANIGGATVTKWTVTQINTPLGVTPAVCTITTPEYQSVVNGVIAPATAVCPVAGEYKASLSGWASPGVDSKYDYDIDFFVHNAPPESSLWDWQISSAPDSSGAFAALLSVSAVDTVDDALTCSINWGDNSPEQVVAYNAQSFQCSGTHKYTAQGDYMVSMTVTDKAGASSAVALLAQVWDNSTGLAHQQISLKTALPVSKQYGTSFNVSANGGLSGNPLVYSSAGSCSNVGNTYTMTDGSGDCIVIINQDGDGVTYDPAPTYYGYVLATKAAVTVTANAASKAYGAADPTFTYKTSGTLYNGDAFTGALGRTAGENVGTYPINLGTLALNSGYQVTFVGANLTITGTAPAVTTQPTAQAVLPGNPVTFTATASGNPAPAVKWQTGSGTNWTDIAGATSASYTFTPTAADDAKQFRAVFSNAVGTVNSSAATLSVVSIASFTPTSGPAGTSVTITGTGFAGATSVKINGTAATNVSITGNTQITAKVAAGSTTGAVSVTKGGVTATSATNFTVTSAPAITTQPTAQIVAGGTSVTFTAAASGSPVPTVQWQSGNGTTFTNIVGATSASYTFTPSGADDGKQYRAVFTNSSGSVTSSAAALTVVSITSFTPTSGPVLTSVVITGTGFTGATAVKFGATSASAFTVSSNTQITATVAAGTLTGAISVTKGGATATSSTNFTVTSAPAITSQPSAQTVTPGTLVTLSAAASGSPTPTVQWQSGNGTTWTDIGGATSASYAFTATAADDGKQFRAVFTNSAGSATSSAAVVTVVSITSFTPTGGPVGTSVVITGTGFTGAAAVTFGGTAAATFTVNSNTQITATVAAGTISGAIAVTKGGVTATSSTNFSIVVLPLVTTQPTSQTVLSGATVTFTAAATGTPTPTVKWQVLPVGGAWTDIAGATSGTYSFVATAADDGKQYRAVFDNGAVVNSSAAVLTVVSITSFNPASGPVGTSVVITGTGFTGATAVKFGATSASAFTVNSNTQITATVATGTATGAISVTKGGVTAVSASSFTVTIASTPPTVTAITPTSGGVGTTVTITGTNFTGATSVKFAGITVGTTVASTFKVLSATSIIASVPTGAGTGGIVVTTPGGSATSASFKGATTLTLPTVTAYSVTSARTGTAFTLTLTGTNFAGTSLVALNGISLAFNLVSATSMTVTIPSSGVASGVVKVTTNGGVSANTNVLNLLSTPVQIAAGTSHSCAALADGTAKCWGLNTNGQLGDNTTAQKTSPVLVSGLTGVSSVATGAAFSCAVLNAGASGTVKCWGLNTNGQLGDGTTTQRLTPVAVANITGATQVVAGASHACALLSDGTVRCWGLNTNGQLGDGTTVQKTSPATTSIAGLTGVTALAAGGSTTCALLSTGAVKCWGLNTNGQLGDNTTAQKLVPTAVSGIDGTAAKATAITVGTSHSCALISDGTVRCWGLNTSGQLGDNTLVQKLIPTTVKATASTNLTGVTAISAGAAHTCAIVGSGSTATARCWGSNANGRLGNGTTTNSSLPVTVTVTLTTGITAIVAGGSHTLALVPSVALAPRAGAAWGLNTNGQLGDASTTQRTSPVVLGLL